MRTRWTIIYPDGNQRDEEADMPEDPGYDLIAALVRPLIGRGNLEHVRVLFDGEPRDMFVDEDGHEKKLPRNNVATKIYRANWMRQHPKDDTESLPFIRGVAVLFPDRPIWF